MTYFLFKITAALAFVMVVGMVGTASTAVAAPQILAAMATKTPQPMGCEDGICSVQITTFCLQKGRSNPKNGTLYIPHIETKLTLIFTHKTGEKFRVAGNDLLRLKSERGFSAVVAQMDASVLQEYDAISAALSIDPGAVLLPVIPASDPDPITQTEISYVMETLRPMADQWIDGSKDKAAAVRLVNTMINQTPITGRMNDDDRRGLWNQVVGYSGQQSMSKGDKYAQDMFGACLWRVEVGRYPNMRSCLELKHDSKLMDMNLSYWKATAAGS